MLFVYIFLYFRCFPWLLTSKMLMQMGRMMNRNLFRTWVCFSVHSWRSMVSWWKRRYFNLLNTQILHTVFYTFPFALMRIILLLTCGYPMGIKGFFYGFRYANVSLTHFASTEISSSAPTWTHCSIWKQHSSLSLKGVWVEHSLMHPRKRTLGIYYYYYHFHGKKNKGFNGI